MKCVRAFLIALILFALCAASICVHGGELPYTHAELRSLSDAFSLDGVAGFVEGRARESIKVTLSNEGASWMCDAITDAINEKKAGGPGIDLSALFKQDEALKLRVKENIKQRLKEWLPNQVKDAVANQLLSEVVGQEQLEEAKRIAQRVQQELDTSLNERIDAVAGNLYDSTIERMRQDLAERGISQWVDVTDLRGSINRAFDVNTAALIASNELSRLVGDGVVLGIRGRIEDALGGNLPPEVLEALKAGPKEFEKYIGQAQKYLPGNQLEALASSFFNKPFIKLPTAAYAAILAGSAAAHYARAFKGMYVDAYELKRAVEVTRVMVWQLKNKQWISLSLMQLGNLARDIAAGLGAGAAFDDVVGRLKKPIEKVQGLADKIDGLLMKPINDVRDELQGVVSQMQKELGELQAALVSPIKEGLANTKAWMQDGLNAAKENIEDTLPEGLNGIPGSWEDAKDALGIKDGALGELGDLKPKDILEDAARKTGLDDAYAKAKQDLEELNDAVSDDLAAAAAEALEGLHLLGPLAEILDVERVPAINPSDKSALDPVLLHNGEYVQKVTDFVIPGRGMDFRFTRTYRGRSQFLGELGWNWTHSYAERVRPWKDGITYVDEEGRKFFFQASEGGYVSEPGLYAQLVRQEDGGFAIYRRDGLTTIFDADGRPKEKRDRHGNRIVYEYDKTGLVSAVVDVFGRKLTFARRKDGLISEIKDFADRSISFQYNDAKELIGVTSPASADFPKGKKTSYRYIRAGDGPAHAISMIMDPNGRVWLRLRYDKDGRVIAQRYGDDAWMRVSYAKGSGDVASRTWVTDQLGITRLYEHDSQGHLLRRWRYDGKAYVLLNSYHYNTDGEGTLACLPSGRCTAFKYGSQDSAGLLTEIRELPNDSAKPRITRIEHEPKYGRVSRIDFPTGVSERVEYADDAASDPRAVFRKADNDAHWKRVVFYSFNPFGQITSETDVRGVVTTYDYYSASDPDGDGVPANKNGNRETGGYLKTIVRDAIATENRNASGAPIAATTTFEYDPLGNIVSTTDASGRAVKFFVNSLNQVLREEQPGLWPVRYEFDADDNLVGVEIGRPERKIVHKFEYGALDRLLVKSEQVSQGQIANTHYVYDGTGRLSRMIKPEGNSIDYEYDQEGRLACIIRGATTLSRSRECVKRDEDGNVIAQIDGSSVKNEFKLNGFGERIAEIDALRNRTEWERDDAGRIVAIKNLDARGKLLAEDRLTYEGDFLVKCSQRLWRDDLANSRWVETSWEYDDAGNMVSEIDPLGARTTFDRNGMGMIVASVDADGKRQIFVRDTLGRIIEFYVDSAEKKLGLEEMTYDEAGRLASYNRGFANPRHYEYDGQGNLVRLADPGKGVTHFDVDDLGRQVAIRRENAATRFAWDGNGRLVRATDANGNTTSFGYDDLDRLISEKFADGSEKRTSYDGAGRVIGIEGRGSALTIEYDARGRLSSRTARLGEAIGVQRFYHDGMGRLTSAEDKGDHEKAGEAVVSRFFYDSLSRPVAEYASGRWITRGFDDAGRIVSLGLPGGDSFFYYHSPAGTLKAVMGGSKRIASFERDEMGNVISQKLAERLKLEIERDMWGREISRRYASIAGKPMAEWKYELDEAGRVLTEHDSLSGVSRRYERDSMGRLVGVKESPSPLTLSRQGRGDKEWAYEYDPVGNILKAQDGNIVKQMEYNELNQIKSVQYDESGNIISDGTWRYEYDPWGRLITAHRGNELMARYRYDAFDRRVEENFADISHEHIWDGWRLMHTAATNDATQSFMYADGLSAPLASISAGFPSLMLSDRTGSVRGIDGTDNKLSARCDYGPYGEDITCETDQAIYDSLFGYAGHLRGAEGKLTYMRYRSYDPMLMRFISPDPLGYKIALYHNAEALYGPSLSYHEAQGAASQASIPNRPMSPSASYNIFPFGRFFGRPDSSASPGEMGLYAYAGNDPSTFWDPLGLAKLIFERNENRMVLVDKDGWEVSEYEAGNQVDKPDADPIVLGGNGPFPDGTFSLSVPQFYTTDYRDEFYERFGLGEVTQGESEVTGPGWNGDRKGDYNVSQGSIRIRAGAPTSGVDQTAWDRELFIHGGRDNDPTFETYGCIRARDDELETLAANFIAFQRQGDPISELVVK